MAAHESSGPRSATDVPLRSATTRARGGWPARVVRWVMPALQPVHLTSRAAGSGACRQVRQVSPLCALLAVLKRQGVTAGVDLARQQGRNVHCIFSQLTVQVSLLATLRGAGMQRCTAHFLACILAGQPPHSSGTWECRVCVCNWLQHAVERACAEGAARNRPHLSPWRAQARAAPHAKAAPAPSCRPAAATHPPPPACC